MKLLKSKAGFTMVEMLIVMLIISILSLIIIPNIHTTRDNVHEEGKAALTQVIQTQMDLYKFDKGLSSNPTLDQLKAEGYINEKQLLKAEEWALFAE